MNYDDTVAYLYELLPAFQKQGSKALNYKLDKVRSLCRELGNPEKSFKSIHIAGTNGKGSTSHILASILQEAGFKTGLYTSPHLKDFRERFKVNGRLAPKQFVINFVKKHKSIIEKLQPSFFELTVAMGFYYFQEQEVEWAVVEVGLGGRLDSTNIISPEICLITNISYDHQELLGNTLPLIAQEKAGIMKKHIPTVISEYQKEVEEVFRNQAQKAGCELYYAKDLLARSTHNFFGLNYNSIQSLIQGSPLKGTYQSKNIRGALASLKILIDSKAIAVKNDNISNCISNGISRVISNTRLKGRWQVLAKKPYTVADTGHNEEAFKYLLEHLHKSDYRHIYMILGFAKDKDPAKLLKQLPKNVRLILTEFKGDRATPISKLAKMVSNYSFTANNANEGLAWAREEAEENDMIFIGGSTFIVAEIDEL